MPYDALHENVDALLLLVSLAHCPAAAPLATLAELRTALKEELKPARGKGTAENSTRQTLLKSLADQLPEKEVTDEQLSQTLQTTTQLRTYSQSKKVQELSQALANELRARAKEAAMRLQEEVNKTLPRCVREGLKAAKSADLDAPLKEIADLKKRAQAFQFRSADSQSVTRGVQTIEQLLSAFQDALFAAEKGNTATDYTQRLSGSHSSRDLSDIIPRSELLELVNSAQARLPKKQPAPVASSTEEVDQQISAIIAGMKKLEELEGAVKQVDDLIARQRKAGRYSSDTSAVTDLKNLRNFHQEVLSGMATTLDSSLTGSKPKDENIALLRNMLIRFAVPRLFGMAADKGMKEDESLAVFTRRSVTEAIELRDWKLLARALDLSQRLAPGQSALSTGDSSALQQFLAAQNQERARQYGAAVASYLAALKTGSQSIPAEFIGERLGTIEKEHPKEYQAGVDLVNNPSAVRYTATSGAPKTVFSASGEPCSQVTATLPVRVGPRPTPVPASAPQKTEPKPPSPTPAEAKPTEPHRLKRRAIRAGNSGPRKPPSGCTACAAAHLRRRLIS
jgi:hypothetical protein